MRPFANLCYVSFVVFTYFKIFQCLGTAALIQANWFLTASQIVIDVGVRSVVIKTSDDWMVQFGMCQRQNTTCNINKIWKYYLRYPSKQKQLKHFSYLKASAHSSTHSSWDNKPLTMSAFSLFFAVDNVSAINNKLFCIMTYSLIHPNSFRVQI